MCVRMRTDCVGQVDTAGIDILLVGDSVAMVVHGHDTTLPVTLDEMLMHCKAVSRGSQRHAYFTNTLFEHSGLEEVESKTMHLV